jgi:hypothetical protein
MAPAKINYKIYEGSTFQETFRWEADTKIYVPIQSISKTAPCVITTVSNHSIPIGWRIRVVGAQGMKEINNTSDDSYYIVTAVTSNTVTINKLNSLNYSVHTASTGVIEYNQPVPLAGYTGVMQIRETLDSATVIHEMNSTNNQVYVDTTNNNITITIPAATTRDFDFTTAVYSLELTQGTFVVPFLTGNMTLVREVTR